jgi:hypothetical protein
MGMFSNSLIQGLINPSFGDSLSQVGMLAGSYDRRRRQKQEEEAKLAAEKMQQQQQQTALMSAYGMGQNPGGSNPTAAMAAMAQSIPGLQAKDLIAMQQAGVQTEQAKEAKGNEVRVANAKKAISQLLSRNDANDPKVQQGVRKIALETGVPMDEVNLLISSSAGGSGIEGRDRYVTAGPNIFDMQTGTWNTPPSKQEVSAMEPKDIAKLYEKFTPESVQEFIKEPTSVLNTLEDVSDSPEDMTAQQKTAKLLATDNTMEVIDNILKISDDVWAGTYPVAKSVPMTSALALETDLATVRASLAFDRLQKMKNESETGGALGQVSNIELKLLESAVAGLNPASPNFKANLERVRRSYDDFRRAIIGLTPSSDKYKKVENEVYYKKENKWYTLGEIE